MVNTILGPLDLPVNFWSEVDLLTTRILTLLLPVLNLLDVHFSASRSAPLAPIHADLHTLVAEAGFLAVCMRRSYSIFRHAHTMAKVKIVVWPGLDRYSRRGYGKTEEMEVAHVRKATVGYYCGGNGLDDDANEARPTLREYIREVEERETRERLWFQGNRLSSGEILGLTGLLLAVLGLLLFHEYLLELLGRSLDGYLWDHGDVYREAPLEAVHVVEETRLGGQRQTWKEDSFVSRFLAWLGRVVILGTGGAT
ncbi:hypothetical protein GE09DRAFT_1088935 [Coniochaeta sp. 2T2.1]|nr:hypothetical protein GE09DRAFT_1088935 [Coniochaeta sp. 2T2.1]